jgi:hypothetical protein
MDSQIIMKRWLILLLLAFQAEGFAAPAAILTRLSGKIMILRGSQTIAPRAGLPLQNGDEIRVENGAARPIVYPIDAFAQR